MENANQSILNSISRIINHNKPMNLEDVNVFQGYVFGYNNEYPDAVDVVSMDNSIIIKAVSLSAMYGNKQGIIYKPTIKSEVTVLVIGGVVGYVIAFTHLDNVSTIANIESYIGVTGLQQANDSQDYDEVGENGKRSGTRYNETSAITEVSQDNSSSKISVHFNSISNQVGNNSFLNISDGLVEQKVGTSTTKLEDGSYSVDANRISLGKNANENAVLGVKLQTALNAFVDAVASITTTTSLGAMPILNIPQVQALKAEIAKILSNTNFIE